MADVFRMSKVKHYPRPHDMSVAYRQNAHTAGGTGSVMFQLLRYDEGQGDPSAYNANREHPSFAVSNDAGCFPDSRVNQIKAAAKISLTKHAIETDKVSHMKVAYQVIAVSFKEDIEASDEMSGLDIGTILELQKESTDRQAYALYNGTDCVAKYTNSVDTHNDVSGLTTDNNLEGDDFDPEVFYDQLQYGSLSRKLQSVQFGLKWLTLTAERPYRTIRINIKRKVKYMHPYTALFIRTYVPVAGTKYQVQATSELTGASTHIDVQIQSRFNEWNQEFDMGRT